jgi:DNA polymerase/3'-5' exonuclease PolX
VSLGQRVSLLPATIAAEDVIDLLKGAVVRAEIAGSIRREVEAVGDIEIVAEPLMTSEDVQDGLFETKVVVTNRLLERVDELVAEERLLPHPEDPKRGDRYQKLLDPYSGLQVDLFMVLPPAEYGVIHLIRTGSAHYSEWFVTECRRHGFHVKDGALHVGGLGCTVQPCKVVPTPTESHVYAATGIRFTPAHLR